MAADVAASATYGEPMTVSMSGGHLLLLLLAAAAADADADADAFTCTVGEGLKPYCSLANKSSCSGCCCC